MLLRGRCAAQLRLNGLDPFPAIGPGDNVAIGDEALIFHGQLVEPVSQLSV